MKEPINKEAIDSYSERDRRSIMSIGFGILAAFAIIISLILVTYRGRRLQTEHVRDMASLSEDTAVLVGTSQRIALLQYGLLGKRESTIEDKLNQELARENTKFSDLLISINHKIAASSLVTPETLAKSAELSRICQNFLEASNALVSETLPQGNALRFADLTTQVISQARATQHMISTDAVLSASLEDAMLEQLHWATLILIILLGLFVIFFVTHRVSQEFAKRRRSEADLARANQELEHFSAIVAHDLRGPLNNLNLSAQMLAAETMDLVSAREQLVPLISAETKRLRDMVTALLQLSRAGNTELHLHRVKIVDLVEAVKTSIKMQLENAAATIVVSRDSWVKVDSLLFQNVLQNLIENSLKYKSPGSSPSITISAQAAEEGWTEITYEDNGLGIPPNIRERVFEPFFQSDRQREGLGLGLSLVSKILRRHSATISIQDKPGPGTRFIIRVPKSIKNWQFY